MKDYKVNSYSKRDDSFSISMIASIIVVITFYMAWQEIHKYFGF